MTLNRCYIMSCREFTWLWIQRRRCRAVDQMIAVTHFSTVHMLQLGLLWVSSSKQSRMRLVFGRPPTFVRSVSQRFIHYVKDEIRIWDNEWIFARPTTLKTTQTTIADFAPGAEFRGATWRVTVNNSLATSPVSVFGHCVKRNVIQKTRST